jgi:hypothetical protein
LSDEEPCGDTEYRMVLESAPPPLVRGTMQGFLSGPAGTRLRGPARFPAVLGLSGLSGLGQDDDGGLPEDFFGGLSETPSLPTDSSGLPTGFFSGATASPVIPLSSPLAQPVGPAIAPVLPTSDMSFAPTAPVVGVPSPTTSVAAPGVAGAITASATAINTALKSTMAPSATALTAAQQAALAAQNPFNTVIPGLNMSVGTVLLMAGVLVGGAVLVSKLK